MKKPVMDKKPLPSAYDLSGVHAFCRRPNLALIAYKIMADEEKKRPVKKSKRKTTSHDIGNLRSRLRFIRQIIEAVDLRCMASDGPALETLTEMTQYEIMRIYRLACVPKKKPSKKKAPTRQPKRG